MYFCAAIVCTFILPQTKGDDLIKIDFINTLTHYTCLDLGIDLIKNIDTFGNIKMEYPFLSE